MLLPRASLDALGIPVLYMYSKSVCCAALLTAFLLAAVLFILCAHVYRLLFRSLFILSYCLSRTNKSVNSSLAADVALLYLVVVWTTMEPFVIMPTSTTVILSVLLYCSVVLHP